MEKFFDENNLLWTILPAVILVVCIILLIILLLKRRKRKAAPVHAPAPVVQPMINVQHVFISYLNKLSVQCNERSEEIKKISKTYKPAEGQYFDFSTLKRGFLNNGLIDPEKLVRDFRSLDDHPAAPRIARALMEVNMDIRTEEEGIRALEQNFKANYDQLIQAFGQNIVQLSHLHDQLRHYSKGKRLKPDVDAFVKQYLGVFQHWASAGADKNIKVMRNKLVLKILAVNEEHPKNPFAKQIEEFGLKCEAAYEEITRCDSQMLEKLHHYERAYVKAVRIIKLISSPYRREQGRPVHKHAPPSQSTTHPPSTTALPPTGTVVVPGSGTSSPPPPPPSDTTPKTLSPQAQATLAKLNMEVPVVPPEHLATPKGKKGETKWTPSRWAKVIIGSLLTVVLLAAGGYYGWKYFQSEEPFLHMGISQAAPNPNDKFDSHGHHYNLIQSVLDSIFPPAVHQGVLDSLDNHIDSLQQVAPDSVQAVKAIRDSLQQVQDASKLPEPHYGIDVSHFQGEVDWVSVAADSTSSIGIRFAIIKSSQGTRADPKFSANWTTAKENLHRVGAYHFFSFDVDPVDQAQFFNQTVPLEAGDIRPIIDVESNCNGCPPTGELSTEELIHRIKTFVEEVEKSCRCKVIIYTGNYYYTKYLKGNFPDNDFWLAEYSKDKSIDHIVKSHVAPKDNETAVMWQFTSKGSVQGIDGHVDLNYLPGQYINRIVIE